MDKKPEKFWILVIGSSTVRHSYGSDLVFYPGAPLYYDKEQAMEAARTKLSGNPNQAIMLLELTDLFTCKRPEAIHHSLSED